MDWNLAIERNHAALKRIVAMLGAMAGLASLTSPLAGEDGSARRGEAEALAEPGEGCFSPTPTLPRHLHRAILRLLRPANPAARRLVIVMARGLVVTLAPPRPRKAETGVNLPAQARRHRHSYPGERPRIRVPLLWGGVRSGGATARPQICRCSTRSDPFTPGRSGRQRPAFPASRFPASPRRFPAPPRRPPAPDDPLDATRLALRLQASGAAPDDLPAQASASPVGGRGGRTPAVLAASRPLRPGRPPGQRPANRRTHEVNEILHDLHGLAFDVLEYPDTS